METNIALAEKDCLTIAHTLNVILSYEYTLYTKTLNYHWNVRSVHFFGLHGLFREQYEQLFDMIDEIAERVRVYGVYAYATQTQFLAHSKITESTETGIDDQAMLKQLLHDHELIIRHTRSQVLVFADAGDEGGVNFIGGIIEKHEKIAWMLRAHIV